MPVVTGTITATYGQYFLRSFDYVDVSAWSYTGSNGLVASLIPPGVLANPGEVAVILTGTESGDVRVAVEILDESPTSIPMEDWSEIVEVSLEISGDGAFVTTVDELDEDDPLPDLPAGAIRLRVHARGRDEAYNAVEDPAPVEEHLLQVWPAAPQPENVIKLTDAVGALRRSRQT